MALMLVQGSLFPLIICTREFVPFSFCSVSLSCFDLVKGLCSLFPVLLVSSAFLIYNILIFDQKKKKKSSQWEWRSAAPEFWSLSPLAFCMAIENPLFWYLFSRFIIQEKFRIIIYQLSVLDCDALSSHQASFALSASDPQYPTPKTHKADGSFAEDASIGYRAERVNPSLDSFLAEDVQGDFVDLSFFLDDPASGLSLSGMELISASINWVASPSSVRFQLSLIRVIYFVRPLTLSVGVLVDDLESTSPRVAVLWLLIDRVPTPCSGMELL